MLRRLGLGSLLVVGAISLMTMNHVVGILFAACIVFSPGLLAFLLNALPIGDD